LFEFEFCSYFVKFVNHIIDGHKEEEQEDACHIIKIFGFHSEEDEVMDIHTKQDEVEDVQENQSSLIIGFGSSYKSDNVLHK
jgi:hypothetical protein